MNEQNLPWYKDGLHFKCTECGKCCTGTSGFVWITVEEMGAMAISLDMPLEIFKRKYVRTRGNRFALIEKKTEKGEYDCIFLDGKKCTVYKARPAQCRTFPWWKENLNSKESWELAANDCEGIHEDAPLIPYSQIVQILSTRK